MKGKKEVQFKRKFELGEGAVGGWKCTEATAARIIGKQYELVYPPQLAPPKQGVMAD
jgi:hypothetical protein